MILKQGQPSFTPFWPNVISSFLALTIVLGKRLSQERLGDTASRLPISDKPL